MIEIFKAGNHKGKEYSEDVVKEIAETYDRRRHEAPFLVNHDETQPNQGLVKAVIAFGDRLFAIPHKVVTEFAESVNSGRLPRMSVRLYHPNDPLNPVQGKWGLRHVAAVQIPAVKGMEEPTFSEDADDLLECFSEPIDSKFEDPKSFKSLEFMDWDDMAQAEQWQRMRDWFISKFNLETADQVIPIQFIDSLKISAAQDDMVYAPKPEMQMDYSEGKTVDLEQREAAVAEREAKVLQREAELTKTEFSEYTDRLIGEGKVLPHEKAKIVATLVTLSNASQVVEFSEGGEDKSESLLDTYKSSLEARRKQVDFAEIPQGVDPVDGNDPQAHAELIRQRMAKAKAEGKDISFSEAQRLVEAGK